MPAWSVASSLLLCGIAAATAQPQGVNFGGATSSKPVVGKAEVSNRNNNYNQNSQNQNQQCCCVPDTDSCLDKLTQGGGQDDLVGGGFIDERIVNRPGAGGAQAQLSCPARQKICCFSNSFDFSVFGRTCQAPRETVGGGAPLPQTASQVWRQGCRETLGSGFPQCGTRAFPRPVSGLQHGESSPGEFPWTCLLLNQNNDFIGSCAIIPETFSNDLRRGTSKVITAAHNLKKVGFNEQLKVRVGEWDASAYKGPEQFRHEEYLVPRQNIIRHPQFDAKRLNNDIAILRTSQRINLNHQYASPACLPSCDNQFDYQYSNGTGVRCWVAGWGKDEFDGSFQFRQHKVDVPIVDNFRCNSALKRALNRKQSGVGDRFQLHPSEVCAGTETGKDACTGDGGSPLVCQAQSGRWTVVGLVTWGIGCATDVPGVYAKLSYFRNWINAN